MRAYGVIIWKNVYVRYYLYGLCSEKSLQHEARQALQQGNPGHKMLQRLITRVEPGSPFATACIMTRIATGGNAGHKMARWLIMCSSTGHDSINRRSLLHVIV